MDNLRQWRYFYKYVIEQTVISPRFYRRAGDGVPKE
jgi:hypothetical protein